jgi:hypothetical protein
MVLPPDASSTCAEWDCKADKGDVLRDCVCIKELR